MVRNVLVLCTGNSARSLLAEAILAREGEGRFCAFSAGSKPKGEPHPLAIALLADRGHDTSALRSKSWNEFARASAPEMHIVITVCDSAAGESCPYWPGRPVRAHWGIADPAAATGSREEQQSAFALAYRRLEVRIKALVALPIDTLDGTELQARLVGIGRMEGATLTATDIKSD